MADSQLPSPSAALYQAVASARRRTLAADAARCVRGSPNFVFSPFSLLVVICMAMQGAREQTLEQLARVLPQSEARDVLRLALAPDSELSKVSQTSAVTLALFSRLFMNRHLRQNPDFMSFSSGLVKLCGADGGSDSATSESLVELIDSGDPSKTVAAVNQCIKKATHGQIQQILIKEQLDEDIRLLLVSAAVVRGGWRTPFLDSDTHLAVFYARQGSTVVEQLILMISTCLEPGSPFFLKRGDGVQAIGLPLEDERFVFYAAITTDPENVNAIMRHTPAESSENALPTFDELVTSMREDQRSGKNDAVELCVYLPRFKLTAKENAFELGESFSHVLGIENPFCALHADFSKISGETPTHISAILHQAEFQVNERGVGGSAATVVGTGAVSGLEAERLVLVEFNQPFVFQLRFHPREVTVGAAAAAGPPSDSGHVLLAGYVGDVLAAQQ